MAATTTSAPLTTAATTPRISAKEVQRSVYVMGYYSFLLALDRDYQVKCDFS